MRVVARRSLVVAAAASDEPTLLLEGSWSGDEPGDSLDVSIDGRFAALDVDAERITARIVAAAASDDPAEPNFAELNALRLRYSVVKWLRPIAWRRTLFQRTPREPVRLRLEAHRDAEYAALFRQMSLADGFPLEFDSRESGARGSGTPGNSIALPPNPFWRRLAGRALAGRRKPWDAANGPRVMLSGNPRLLDPICAELVERGVAVAWLYDRFSFGCRKRWHRRGVTQLVCDSSLGRDDWFPPRLLERLEGPLDGPLEYQGVDLGPVVEAWYAALRPSLASSQRRLWLQIGRHVADFRPTHVVVDEDATPQARAAILQGRRWGSTASVVQHGICGVRFGFAPLLADRFCAWDDGSRRQMEAWGARPRTITVTGSPYQERVVEQAKAARAEFVSHGRNTESSRAFAPRILLIGTIPPRDDRPDSIAYHLTTWNYEQLLAAALSAVAEISHDELAIRNHPRTGVDPGLRRLLAAHPNLKVRDTSAVPIAVDLEMSDIVLSFPSSGALDAVRLGKPVIQLCPTDSHEVAPAEWYGFLGTAGTLTELRRLLGTALAAIPQQPRLDFTPGNGATLNGAAARIVDAILRPSDTEADEADDILPAVRSHGEAIR